MSEFLHFNDVRMGKGWGASTFSNRENFKPGKFSTLGKLLKSTSLNMLQKGFPIFSRSSWMRFQGQMKFIYLGFTHYMELCLMSMKDKFQNYIKSIYYFIIYLSQSVLNHFWSKLQSLRVVLTAMTLKTSTLKLT